MKAGEQLATVLQREVTSAIRISTQATGFQKLVVRHIAPGIYKGMDAKSNVLGAKNQLINFSESVHSSITKIRIS